MAATAILALPLDISELRVSNRRLILLAHYGEAADDSSALNLSLSETRARNSARHPVGPGRLSNRRRGRHPGRRADSTFVNFVLISEA